MFTQVYLCLHLLTYVYPCLLVFTYVYHCLLVHVYLYLPMFTRVYLFLPRFTHVYICLPLFTCAMIPWTHEKVGVGARNTHAYNWNHSSLHILMRLLFIAQSKPRPPTKWLVATTRSELPVRFPALVPAKRRSCWLMNDIVSEDHRNLWGVFQYSGVASILRITRLGLCYK